MKKRMILTFMLVVAIFCTLLQPVAFAATSGICGENATWKLENGVLTISGTGDMYNRDDWDNFYDDFEEWLDLSYNEVIIEEGITSIHLLTKASLTSVTIPNSVTAIGDSAFNFCQNLSSVTIPNSVTTIGDGAFNCCGLMSITIPDSVTSIGESAFSFCNLTTVTIPGSVTSIGSSAFGPCYNLTAIYVDEENPNYCSIDGNLFSKDKKTFMQYASGKTDNTYIIPSSVTKIEEFAFCDDSLTSITIPDSVTSIGDNAFMCDNLTDVYYAGTKAQWDAITIYYRDYEDAGVWSINTCPIYDSFIIANIHYNSEQMLSDIEVLINNTKVSFDVPPQIINDRTMVPVRAIFEALGAEVEWNAESRTVTAVKGDITIQLTIDNKVMTVNEKKVELDSPAVIVDSRTLVPVRAISEAFGCDVNWNGEARQVLITK